MEDRKNAEREKIFCRSRTVIACVFHTFNGPEELPQPVRTSTVIPTVTCAHEDTHRSIVPIPNARQPRDRSSSLSCRFLLSPFLSLSFSSSDARRDDTLPAGDKERLARGRAKLEMLIPAGEAQKQETEGVKLAWVTRQS